MGVMGLAALLMPRPPRACGGSQAEEVAGGEVQSKDGTSSARPSALVVNLAGTGWISCCMTRTPATRDVVSEWCQQHPLEPQAADGRGQ